MWIVFVTKQTIIAMWTVITFVLRDFPTLSNLGPKKYTTLLKIGGKFVIVLLRAPRELLCFLCLPSVGSEALMHFFRINAMCSFGPAWWRFVCWAKTTNLVNWWFSRSQLINCLFRKCTPVIFLPCGKTFLINQWMQWFEWTGSCNPFFFHQLFDFFFLRNVLCYFQTASQNVITILWGQDVHLPVGHKYLRLWNLLQYAMNLRSLGMLNSALDQVNISCVDLCFPFHHSVDGGNVEGSIPLEMRSGGLDWDGICVHITEEVPFWMMASLLPTDVFQLVNGSCIHISTTEESIHSRTHQLCCWGPL